MIRDDEDILQEKFGEWDVRLGEALSDGGRGHSEPRPPAVEKFGRPVAGSIPTIVRAFNSVVTRQINQVRQIPGAPVWQHNYYEHIIRDERAYQTIAAYILDNPRQWEWDLSFKNN